MIQINFSPLNIISGGKVSDFSANISQYARVVSGGTTQTVLSQDIEVVRSIGATTENLPSINAYHHSGINYTSLTPYIASIDTQGAVTRITDGLAQIRVSAKAGELFGSKILSGSCQYNAGGTVDTAESWLPKAGSLRYHASQVISSALINRNAGSLSQDIYSTLSYDTSSAGFNIDTGLPTSSVPSQNSAVVNTSCVFNALKFNHTSFSQFDTLPYLATGLTPFKRSTPCHFISPRHAIFASHAGCFDRIVVFTGNDFITVSRVSYINLGNDLSMVYIDQDLPNTVNFMKFLPANWKGYLPKNTPQGFWDRVTAFPAIASFFNEGTNSSSKIQTQSRHLRPISCVFLPDVSSGRYLPTPATNGDEVIKNMGIFANREGSGAIMTELSEFSDFPIGGDSSSAVYIPVNGEFAAIGLIWTQNMASGLFDAATHFPRMMQHLANINGDYRPYSVSTVDMSNIESY